MHVFQFHKGTIRTGNRPTKGGELRKFQFHKGTIRTACLRDRERLDGHFNSIKVRLEQPKSTGNR